MIDVLEPRNEILKQFVDSIYILKKGTGSLEFTAYPSANLPVALFRNATVSFGNSLIIEQSERPNHFAIACNQFTDSVHLQYPQLVDEIAINFKPLGFASHTRLKPVRSKIFAFAAWNALLPELFCNVFGTEDTEEQLNYIELFLLSQYVPLHDEAVLLKSLTLLADTATDYKMQEIADRVGMHYKQLYRLFTENVGCSPAHYRKLMRFRNSVASKLKSGGKVRLVDICYEQDYTDQPYFIKQFKELTGERPARFFKGVSSFGNEKVIFKID